KPHSIGRPHHRRQIICRHPSRQGRLLSPASPPSRCRLSHRVGGYGREHAHARCPRGADRFLRKTRTALAGRIIIWTTTATPTIISSAFSTMLGPLPLSA